MSITLRVLLIIGSLISFFLCILKIKKSQLKVENSVIWMTISILLVLMSIFSDTVEWIALQLGFAAPVNFVFLVIIVFLLIQLYVDNIRISQLNEKIKELDHYIALSEKNNKK